MEDQRLIEREEDIAEEFEEEEDNTEEENEEDREEEEEGLGLIPVERISPEGSVEDDDDDEADEDDDYEDEDDEDEDDDYEDEDEEDYEDEEVEALIPSVTTSLRVSSSTADGLVDNSNACDGNPVSQENGRDDGGKKELSRGEIDVCPICFEAWTSGGDHQICCLPCGHMYGLSCIKRWLLRRQSSKECPQCKSTCTLKDIRLLYVTRLCVADVMSHKEIAESSDANRAYADQPRGYDQWTSFQKAFWDEAQRAHAESMQRLKQMQDDQIQIAKCQIFERERYQQHYYEYTERIRHYMNHKNGLGYLPVAEHIDYSRLPPRTETTRPLPYPGSSPPMYWPQDEAGLSRMRNPFDTSALARSLWHSVFHPPHG